MTQCQRLLKVMKTGARVSRWMAYEHRDLGIVELSSRIGDLKALGYFIAQESITVLNKFGEKVRITEYWIDSDYKFFAKEFIRSAA